MKERTNINLHFGTRMQIMEFIKANYHQVPGTDWWAWDNPRWNDENVANKLSRELKQPVTRFHVRGLRVSIGRLKDRAPSRLFKPERAPTPIPPLVHPNTPQFPPPHAREDDLTHLFQQVRMMQTVIDGLLTTSVSIAKKIADLQGAIAKIEDVVTRPSKPGIVLPDIAVTNGDARNG